MKIQVTKVFAKFINETAKQMNFKVAAEVVELSERGYLLNVGDPDFYQDYNPTTGKFKAILVTYPAEYCAACRYIGTPELVRKFRYNNIRTVDELREMLRDMLEI